MYFEVSPGVDAAADSFRKDRFSGSGYLGGELPVGELDGRAKILNMPARIDVIVLEPVTCVVVARTTSAPDGTWRVRYLDPAQRFTVVGVDRRMRANSAIQDWVQPAQMDP